MHTRSIAGVVAAVIGGATFLIASPAHAETCVPLPPTTGATLEVAGQEVRIPSTSGVAVCVEPGGLPGLPRVHQGPTSIDVVVGAGSGGAGYVAVRYTVDGSATEHRVPIPGTGPGSEVCAASVGTDTRDDCLAKLTTDDDITDIIPTVPPTPTLPPTPTVPPTPTLPPTPTVPPTPTLPPTPEPDPFCHRSTCIPYGGSILQEPYDGLQEFLTDTIQRLRDEAMEILFPDNCTIGPLICHA